MNAIGKLKKLKGVSGKIGRSKKEIRGGLEELFAMDFDRAATKLRAIAAIQTGADPGTRTVKLIEGVEISITAPEGMIRIEPMEVLIQLVKSAVGLRHKLAALAWIPEKRTAILSDLNVQEVTTENVVLWTVLQLMNAQGWRRNALRWYSPLWIDPMAEYNPAELLASLRGEVQDQLSGVPVLTLTGDDVIRTQPMTGPWPGEDLIKFTEIKSTEDQSEDPDKGEPGFEIDDALIDAVRTVESAPVKGTAHDVSDLMD